MDPRVNDTFISLVLSIKCLFGVESGCYVNASSVGPECSRFDAVRVPESCRGVVEAQVAKLEAVRSVIWNTMISLAVSGIEMDENGLKALLDKQAGDSLALMEMEKVATALKMDETGAWAQEISAVVSSVTAPSTRPQRLCEVSRFLGR